jgi:hypothetical protein
VIRSPFSHYVLKPSVLSSGALTGREREIAVYANSIEGQLDTVISVAQRIHTSLAGDAKDQPPLKDSVSLLAVELRKLGLIVQMMATKEKMMSDTTSF